jgi:hypothetical protein
VNKVIFKCKGLQISSVNGCAFIQGLTEEVIKECKYRDLIFIEDKNKHLLLGFIGKQGEREVVYHGQDIAQGEIGFSHGQIISPNETGFWINNLNGESSFEHISNDFLFNLPEYIIETIAR